MADSLFVKIGDEKIDVEVSPGGMFYDKVNRKVSAKTLSGLEKKLREVYGPKGGIQVEEWHSGKRGVVIGRIKSKGWRRNYVNVRWEDGEITEESPNSLCPPLPPEVRAEKKRLEASSEEARNAWEVASNNVMTQRAQHYVEEALNVAFPVK